MCQCNRNVMVVILFTLLLLFQLLIAEPFLNSIKRCLNCTKKEQII